MAAGGNFIDISDAYQQREAERLVGQLMGNDRGDFVLTSKYTRTSNTAAAIAQLVNHRKAMTQAVEASLRRLGTDYLDVYLVHLPDQVTPMAEIPRGFDDLARAGKILYGGFSNFPAWRVAAAVTLAELRGWVPLTAVQMEFSLLQRTAERELLPMAKGLGLGVMGYSPLGGGVLPSKYRQGETGRATLLGARTSSPPYRYYSRAIPRLLYGRAGGWDRFFDFRTKCVEKSKWPGDQPSDLCRAVSG